ncbi:hypothetical protein GCM10010313_28830 [Streptomyces violarus]|uniref:Uncharacterized protein n=1 Tax=Streptomyces violarus TaxID=67380 RepID=A0A7W4ZUT0_9ACTN|nr:DUF6207 family protein [Streptomyces violarus]MBB3079045.1 hypothetical protein [Streptomyces violarus]GHD08483.1 hypothetical protein GCM10010313_28830 [Streptomyces violarus]
MRLRLRLRLPDGTALAVQELLAARCAIALADRTTREPGEPGVRLRSPGQYLRMLMVGV